MANSDHEKKKKFAVLGVSSVLLVAMVAAVAVGLSGGKGEAATASDDNQVSASQKNADLLCHSAEYKDTCKHSLSKASNESNIKELLKTAIHAAAKEVKRQLDNSTLFQDLSKDNMTKQAMDVCHEVLDYAVDGIRKATVTLEKFDLNNIGDYVYDIRVWLSGSLSLQRSCLDGFENTTTDSGKIMTDVMKNSMELSSNALDIITTFNDLAKSFGISFNYGNKDDKDDKEDKNDKEEKDDKEDKDNDHAKASRKLLSSSEGFPSWISQGQRRLLQVGPGPGPGPALKAKPDAVVAQDGSGKFKTLTEALAAAPMMSPKPFVIHVKAGIYKEKVKVEKTMTHITIVGDGPKLTRFTGSLNYKDGVQTFNTATFAVNGDNFMAIDVGFENTAGANKHQAVALRVTADKAIFYNCHMDAYQDTLYSQTFRQFYRDCAISGTVDFVFGDADGVFQNCQLLLRKPLDGQNDIVIAGGRDNEKSPSALIFQSCHFTADPEYQASPVKAPAFLGRPWRAFARTVILDSQIDDLFSSDGYSPFIGQVYHNTCQFYEYNNKGPGADTSKRIRWPGIKTLTPYDAASFYPEKFYTIKNETERDSWIGLSGVPYSLGPLSS